MGYGGILAVLCAILQRPEPELSKRNSIRLIAAYYVLTFLVHSSASALLCAAPRPLPLLLRRPTWRWLTRATLRLNRVEPGLFDAIWRTNRVQYRKSPKRTLLSRSAATFSWLYFSNDDILQRPFLASFSFQRPSPIAPMRQRWAQSTPQLFPLISRIFNHRRGNVRQRLALLQSFQWFSVSEDSFVSSFNIVGAWIDLPGFLSHPLRCSNRWQFQYNLEKEGIELLKKNRKKKRKAEMKAEMKAVDWA